MKIAIIGTGISGLTCAHLLAPKHDIHVFEANNYIGGHTATVNLKTASGSYDIDTGFIVFNDWTYPNFIKLMTKLGVPSQPTSMGFSVKSDSTGLEYNGTNLNSLFVQRTNLIRPSFYRMIKDILRFNKTSVQVLNEDNEDATLSLGAYLKKYKYSSEFQHHYILPMAGAIWSSTNNQVTEFQIKFFVQFFKNHGLLSVDHRPVWQVIKNGSSSYIKPLIKEFEDKIKLNSPAYEVLRKGDQVLLKYKGPDGYKEEEFDHIIIATHSDQAIRMIKDPTPDETRIFSSLKYQSNSVLLHTDESILPKKNLGRAAWNYLITKGDQKQVTVTYDMNILQNIKSPETFCVSLNMDHLIDPQKILRKFTYEHPVFTQETIKSQACWHEVSGRNRTHFCGAYWGNGFHEDGVNSALKVCSYFGETL